jgi:hypothetical protein
MVPIAYYSALLSFQLLQVGHALPTEQQVLKDEARITSVLEVRDEYVHNIENLEDQ